MNRSAPLARLAAGALIVCILFLTVSCGTLLHPERRGQPAGRIDPAIVLLDGLGLLLFFIPGVIAFAVDFSNGTIYIPPEECRHADVRPHDESGFVAVRFEPGTLTRAALEDAVNSATGRAVRLAPGGYQTESIESLAGFRSAENKLAKRTATIEERNTQVRAQSE